MMIITIASLIMIGVIIGVNINSMLDKQNGSKLQVLEELVTIYEAHEIELKEKIKYYKAGMNETLEQNIYLQRKLSDRN